MSKKIIPLALGATLLALSFPAVAQQPKKMARIGHLSPRSGPTALVTAFKEGLRGLRQQIINFAARNKLPAIYPSSGFVNGGGLMSYGTNVPGLWRRAAETT